MLDGAAAGAHVRARPRPRPGTRRCARRGVDVLQINVGKRCNQACHHCHVDAGPDRTRGDARRGRRRVPRVPRASRHPHARHHRRRARAAPALPRHRRARARGRPPRDGPLQPHHHAAAQLRRPAASSSPSTRSRWSRRCRRSPRGRPTRSAARACSRQSIAALRRFNALGYGVEGSGLLLNLVTNPVGAFLPGGAGGARARLEARAAAPATASSFNRLYTITNMPISRYLEFLVRLGQPAGLHGASWSRRSTPPPWTG